MLFDTHAHLNDDAFENDLEDIVGKIKEQNFAGVMNVGFDYPSSVYAVKLAEEVDIFYAAVGMHPHDSRDYTEKMEEDFIKLSEHEKVRAYGEIGLDYHYDNSPRDVQREVFIRQLEVAEKLKKPVIIHSRDAAGDTFEILKNHLGDNTGIIHSCSQSTEMVKEYVKMGMYISFSGTLTFKNANKVRAAASAVPVDRLLVETDCPYLTPVPHRGKKNDPTYVIHTMRRLADVKGFEYDEFEAIMLENAKRIFALD